MKVAERARDWLAHAEAREAAGALAVIAICCGATLFAVRSGKRVGPERCDALLDRYVELRARTVDERIGDDALDDKRAKARARVDASCRERLTEETARCATEAPSLDVFERCFP